jgi:hypothetical protein
MNYINNITGEQKTHKQLCSELNVSIPRGMDYLDWMVIRQQPMPEVPAGFYAVQNGVEKKDGIWVYGWSVIETPPEPVVIPQRVSAFQGLAQLEVEGVLEAVEAYFEAESTPRLEKLAWMKVSYFERQSPLVQSMAEMLQWDDAKLDQVFTDADKIKA